MEGTAWLCVLALCGLASHSILAQTEAYAQTSRDPSETSQIFASAACPSSDADVCISINSTDQELAVVQALHDSTDSSKTADEMSPVNFQNDSYNSTAINPFPDVNAIEFQRLYDNMLKVNWYIVVVVYPSVGVLGLVSNTISATVLVKSGFKKPSNIFLLALTVADSFCLLGAVNVSYILLHFPKFFPFGSFFWEYPRSEAFACYVFGVACRCLTVYGIYVSSALCAVVTLERLLAVYFPLHFITMVTPARAWFVSFTCFLFWVPYLIYTGIEWYTFIYSYYTRYDVWISAGYMLYNDSDLNIALDLYLGAIFGKFIPLAFVAVGSVLITIKVSITLRKRQKMVATSDKTKSSSGSRTTTTLLVVCLTFAVTKIIGLPSYFYTPTTDIYLVYFWNFYGSFINIAEYANAGCNFFIYVFLNKKFRVVFLSMFSRKKR